MRLLVRASTIRAPTTAPPEPKIYFIGRQGTSGRASFVLSDGEVRAVGSQGTGGSSAFSVAQNGTQGTRGYVRFGIQFLGEQNTAGRVTFQATAAVGYAHNRILVMERQADLASGAFANHVLRGQITATWLKQSNLTGGRIRHPQCYDLIFETLDATPVRLDHEIESYDGTNGVLQVAIRVLSWTAQTAQYLFRARYGADL
jgi:hypothetical protein